MSRRFGLSSVVDPSRRAVEGSFLHGPRIPRGGLGAACTRTFLDLALVDAATPGRFTRYGNKYEIRASLKRAGRTIGNSADGLDGKARRRFSLDSSPPFRMTEHESHAPGTQLFCSATCPNTAFVAAIWAQWLRCMSQKESRSSL